MTFNHYFMDQTLKISRFNESKNLAHNIDFATYRLPVTLVNTLFIARVTTAADEIKY